MMKKITNHDEKAKKLCILLALSFTHKATEDKTPALQMATDCPNNETIAAYFDSKLSNTEEKKFLDALILCPESYSMWLSMLETLDYPYQNEQLNLNTYQQESFIFSIFMTTINWFKSHQVSLMGAMATSFLFLFVINFTHIPFTQLPIDKQIVKIWKNSESLDLAYIDVSQFTQRGQSKSSFNIMPFPEKIAFSSGFKQGLINMSVVSQQIKTSPKTLDFLNSLPDQALHCENSLCEKETLLNTQLGMWSSFVLQECQQQKQNVKKSTYWDKQNIVIKHFIQEYQNIDQHLGKNIKHPNSLIKKINKIERSIDTLISSKSLKENLEQSIVCNNIKQLALSSIQSL